MTTALDDFEQRLAANLAAGGAPLEKSYAVDIFETRDGRRHWKHELYAGQDYGAAWDIWKSYVDNGVKASLRVVYTRG
jgi:hypothetical protein